MMLASIAAVCTYSSAGLFAYRAPVLAFFEGYSADAADVSLVFLWSICGIS